MTADHALTISASAVLAIAVTAATFAFVAATPRQVVQSPTPTLAEQYTDAWHSLKEYP